MIKIEQLTKFFGSNKDFCAVDDVSFSCENGKVTGLLGPNGAGKTTTLRMVSGLIKPNFGDVTIDEHLMSADPRKARASIGIQSDMNGVYPNLTVREQLMFYGRFYGLSNTELEKNTNEVIEILEMKDIADRRAEGFSLGQRQKLVLGRAMLHQPNNLLLDEPTNGLDLTSVNSIRNLVSRLRDMGRCILFSTHYMDEAEKLCDMTHIIVKGKIMASGSPDELKERTSTDTFEKAVLSIVKGNELTDLAKSEVAQ